MSHFLKRLELNGFKSFAGKTVLEFPAGIVAVVGPNGSGKSNIVDALRWLLGEREAKNLRGGRVEDLIFAGTQKRARVGMANASLHFENRNKFFPVDFEEVVITRQVSRSGDSKYFLNKSEVLLRDLIDFFAKARMGSRGLIIIGQGDSDLFIRSTPHERREMIEELLGLREYQLKKSDAERRLKNSRINLDKTRALVEEILPHLRSLKRQTSRWEKRGALEEELRGLESTFFGSQLGELAARRAAIEEKIATSRKEFDGLDAERRAAEKRQTEIEASQPEEKKNLAAVRSEIQKLGDRRNTLQKDVGRLEAQLELAQAQAKSTAMGASAVGLSASSSVAGAGVFSRGPSVDRLVSVIKMVKDELERALEEEMLELHATVENILEEIKDALAEAEGAEQAASREASREVAKPASGHATAAPTIPNPITAQLKSQFEKLGDDLSALEKQIIELREKERALEQCQEGFYAQFKAAVAHVQRAKDHIAAWENRNREHLLEKERVELRREEVLHQIAQAGRRAEEFEHAGGSGGRGEHEASGLRKHAHHMSESDLAEMERRIFRLRGELAAIGDVDQALMKEARDTEERYGFLVKESEDLEKAVADLTRLMQDLSEKIKTEFAKSLSRINEEFAKFFALMFGGGLAKLTLEKPRAPKKKDELDEGAGAGGDGATGAKDETIEEVIEREPGVEIDVRLPRKKVTTLDMLSGGERSLVGIAALFAMVSVSPPPFLVLDEIDAPLDERNARRFGEMLKEFSKKTQFIVVTHNRATMETADILYGVTLGDDGSSKIVSLKLEPAPKPAA